MTRTSAILVALLVVVPAIECHAASTPPPVHANQKRFRIPFRYDPAELQQLQATEIRLFVSLNRGADWRYAQSVAPDAGRFEFVADQDGEFWFSVRTLDSKNGMHPAGDLLEPGLKVIVDTQAPRLELKLREMTPGKIELAWVAQDEHLDPKTLSLEYFQTGLQRWEQVGIVPQSNGQTSWSLPQGGNVAVRGSVGDAAGNVVRTQVQTTILPAKESVPKRGAPAIREPVAIGDGPGQAAVSPQNPGDEFAPRITPATNPSDAAGRATIGPREVPGSRSHQAMRIGTPEQQLVSSGNVQRPQIATGRFPDGPAPESVSNPSGRVRLVNSTMFQIGYRVDELDASGIGSVDLYITEDNGKMWWKYGEDTDRKSPFDAEVPRDGTYGFEIRVKNGAGVAVDPPKPGDEPSLTVIVDRMAPSAKLFPIEHGGGADKSRLVISWQVADEHADQLPIALYYAARLDGPWVPIVGWRENSQRYEWQVGPEAPPEVYIRLVARDAAGNLTQVDTPEAVVINRSKPLARIVDVESVQTDDSPR